MMKASDDFLNAVLPTRDPGAVSTGVLAQAIRGPKRSETARWIGILSDALAGAAGMPGQYAKAVQQNRQFEMEQERNTLLNDLTRAQAERARMPAGAAAPEPTTLQRNYEWLSRINPAAAQSFLENETTAPPMVMNNPDGTRTLYPRGAIPRQPSGGILKQLPPGVVPYGGGGASPSGSRGFP